MRPAYKRLEDLEEDTDTNDQHQEGFNDDLEIPAFLRKQMD